MRFEAAGDLVQCRQVIRGCGAIELLPERRKVLFADRARFPALWFRGRCELIRQAVQLLRQRHQLRNLIRRARAARARGSVPRRRQLLHVCVGPRRNHRRCRLVDRGAVDVNLLQFAVDADAFSFRRHRRRRAQKPPALRRSGGRLPGSVADPGMGPSTDRWSLAAPATARIPPESHGTPVR